ncbi:hypothetical protein H4P12_00160 [Paracoccus sp. 11-3]|uniref:Uncharacterized protein n=1 Tax=Paracoccus amoyensis TaxID=2760093 RepID=A0A926GD15_9RHOB|nr:hypothetical protein [Paracoccus amoyensis]MBC9245159.1 hypothetical protein [Paracoccus amoyensis]
MIEIGKSYRLVMIERDDDGYHTGSIGVTVTGRDGNLLQVNGCEVINMASPLFHSLIDEEGQRAYFKRLDEKFKAGLSGNDEDFS